MALDAEGRVHVLELKRDRTPRDVVAQALDYGSWAKDLSLEELEQIHQDSGDGDTRLDEAFAEHFGSPLPDVVGAEQQFTIVASELDATSDRIIEFLAESYDVPINAVFFRHFADGGCEYLARYCALLPSVRAVATVRIWLRDHLRRTGTGLNSRRMVQSRMRGCRLAATGRATPKRRRSVLSFRDGSAMAIITVP